MIWNEKEFDEQFSYPNARSGLRKLYRHPNGKLIASMRATDTEVKQFISKQIEEAVKRRDEELLKLAEEVEKDNPYSHNRTVIRLFLQGRLE